MTRVGVESRGYIHGDDGAFGAGECVYEFGVYAAGRTSNARAQEGVNGDVGIGQGVLHCCDAINRLHDVRGQSVEVGFCIACYFPGGCGCEYLDFCTALGRLSGDDKAVAAVVAFATEDDDVPILEFAQQVFYCPGYALPGGFHEFDARHTTVNCPTVNRCHLGAGDKLNHRGGCEVVRAV